MQKWSNKNGFFISIISVQLLSALFILFSGCRNTISQQESDKIDSKLSQNIASEYNPAYIRYRSFQNPDSTWGFTIFVNSRPYLHQKRIPVPGAVSGFQTKMDADKVAGLFVKMIRNGDLNPKLNKNEIDTLLLITRTKN